MKEKYKKIVVNWLITGAVLVLLMVVIGGITRLTHSGLSMVNWKPVSGILPPLNEEQWMVEFKNYQQYPEYQKINYDFGISEFKSIFWWEYIHRALGRIIGLIFIIPFILFLYKKVFDKSWVKKLIILLFLGGFQGFLGWFMVKSGLVDKPSVSHFRLAIHFCAALTVYSYIIWLILSIKKPGNLSFSDLKSKGVYWSVAFFMLFALQIIYGAFVAGLKAGLIFNTWPKMGDVWMSPLIITALDKHGLSALLEDPITIQFIHRLLPYLILIPVLALIFNKYKEIKTSAKYLLIVYAVQVLLGISTLLLSVPVSLGVAHQLFAVTLLSVGLIILYKQLTSPNTENELNSSSKHL